MSGIYCDILSGIYSGILSGIFADIHSGTLSGILSGRRAQLHPELAVGFGSSVPSVTTSWQRKKKEEEGRRKKKEEEGRRKKKEEEGRRRKKKEEGRRRKKKKGGRRRQKDLHLCYNLETLTWQVGNSTIPTKIYSEFIRLYLLLLQPISPTVLPYSHVFTAYQ